MYRLNTENGGFTPDKSRGPKAPRDLSGVKPTFEVFNRLKKNDQGGLLKKSQEIEYIYSVDFAGLYI